MRKTVWWANFFERPTYKKIGRCLPKLFLFQNENCSFIYKLWMVKLVCHLLIVWLNFQVNILTVMKQTKSNDVLPEFMHEKPSHKGKKSMTIFNKNGSNISNTKLFWTHRFLSAQSFLVEVILNLEFMCSSKKVLISLIMLSFSSQMCL